MKTTKNKRSLLMFGMTSESVGKDSLVFHVRDLLRLDEKIS